MPAAVPTPAPEARPAGEALMSTEEVADFLGLSTSTLHDWRLRGVGPPAYKVGRHLRFRRGDLETWLADRRDR